MARLPGCFEVAHHHLQLEVGDFHRGFCLLHWTSRCSLLPPSLEKFDVMFWCLLYFLYFLNMFVWCLWNILMCRSFAICLCRLTSQCTWIAPPVASGSPLASPFPKALPWLVWLVDVMLCHVVSVVEFVVSVCVSSEARSFSQSLWVQLMAKSIKIQSWEQNGANRKPFLEINGNQLRPCRALPLKEKLLVLERPYKQEATAIRMKGEGRSCCNLKPLTDSHDCWSLLLHSHSHFAFYSFLRQILRHSLRWQVQMSFCPRSLCVTFGFLRRLPRGKHLEAETKIELVLTWLNYA